MDRDKCLGSKDLQFQVEGFRDVGFRGLVLRLRDLEFQVAAFTCFLLVTERMEKNMEAITLSGDS